MLIISAFIKCTPISFPILIPRGRGESRPSIHVINEANPAGDYSQRQNK